MNKYICIHGHFYQPPRENPWLEEVEYQDNAYPYHDWNERITAECYAPNAASRILDAQGRIIDIVNIYSKISFDFGPTLLSWLERHKPDVYQAILDADRMSIERFSGHGSALAHAYNHMIMPLANRRDKYTQIIWGIRDFQKRFNRFPEGMWLPETAVDIETLEVIVSLGIKFTILTPRQAKRIIKKGDDESWHDVSGEKVDPTMAYQCVLPSGRTINLFFYDAPISRDVSFGGLLNNGEAFAKRLLDAFNGSRTWAQIVNIATDGETFGHHHRHGDMALSYCLHYIETNSDVKVTNYGEYLEKHPPTHIVEIYENSSWSCIHGIERWRDNCGCNTGLHPQWTQVWRKPLRMSLDWLRDELIPIFHNEASEYFKNPWDVRNEYIDVIFDRSEENVEEFLRRHAVKKLSKEQKVRALKLLEMQRNAMLMYTSCGWFFDDVSGIEAVQIMSYASKAIQYAEELQGMLLEPEFIRRLKEAPSNVFNNGAEPYEIFVKPSRSDLLRVGAHYSISSIFEEYADEIKICCYTAKSEVYNKLEAGKLTLVTGKANIKSDITWEEETISFAVIHLGDHNINGCVKEFNGQESFLAMQKEIQDAFEKGDVTGVIRLMDKHFKGNIYSLWHLFKDEQRKILHQILQLTYEDVETSYRRVFENNYAIMNFFHSLNIPLPKPFSSAAEYILNNDLKRIFEDTEFDIERLEKLIVDAKKWSIKIDTTIMGFVVSSWVESAMEQLSEQTHNIHLFEMIDNVMEILKPLSLTLNLWKAQNIYFSISRKVLRYMEDRVSNGDREAMRWMEEFRRLGDYLHVKI
jgi:alpha-amylase/alpha-mannosidase (GH57 family)